MKKKSIILSMMAVMLVALFGVGFAACGDDDNGGSGVSVIGTWTGQEGRHTLTLIFKDGGSGTFIEKYNDSYSGMETETGSFSYTIEGGSKGMIIVQLYDSYSGKENEIFYWMIEGNTMFLYEHGYGDDLEYVLTKQ